MKKRWICCISTGAIFLLIAGMWLGTKISMEQINNQNNYNSGIKSTIAVINQDIGIHNGAETINYSDALISTLNDDYKVVSYKEAQSGMEQGIYSAIVTFPSTLSSQVYSINESDLQSPKVEFTVNPSLTEEVYISTYLRMLDLQNDINQAISYLYLVSIYDEFHSAQDQVKKIFQNDDDDIKALNSVQLHDFRLNVDWSDIPETNFEPKEINFDDFIATVQGYADNMSNQYVDSYAVAQSDYENFQNSFSAMATAISSESSLWFDDVNERENDVTEYANEVSDYRNSVFEWSGDVQQWNADTKTWNEELDIYRESLLEYCTNLVNELKQNYFNPIKDYHKTLHNSYFGTEEEEGLADQVTNYYVVVQNYEQAVLNYKNDLEQYMLSYDESLEQYYNDRYVAGNANAEKPTFDLDSVILGTDEDQQYDFDAIRENIDTIFAALEETCETQEELITKAEQELDQLFSNDEMIPPSGPSYSDENLPGSYNSDSILPGNLTDFNQIPPSFLGEDFPTLGIEPPQLLEGTVPAVPEQLIENCNAIVSESAKYIPSNYLNDKTKSQVDAIVNAYASHLDIVDSNLNNNMNTNNHALLQAYHEYNSYISTLYGDATQAYTAQETDLMDTLNAFYNVKKATSDENKKLLGAFSAKLPNSRINAVTNKDLVNFVISPVQFVSGNIRAGVQTETSFHEFQLNIYSIILMCLIALIIISICIALMMYRIDFKKLSKMNKDITISSNS